MATELLDAPLAPVTSTLPDLRGVPLALLGEKARVPLSETLERVLPTPEIQQVPVAAFNSSIMIVLAAMLLLRRPGRSSR